MKKLTKVQTIALVVIGVIILIGFGWINLSQMRSTNKKSGSDTASKMPDPGAEARKKYQENKKKEKEEKSSQTTPSLSGDDMPPVSPPSKTESSQKTSAKDRFISSDQRGEVSGVVPQGSILTEAPPVAPPTPKISAPQDDIGRRVIETPSTRVNTSNVTPGIPSALLSQTPPEEAQTSSRPLIPAQIKVRPGRYRFNNLTDDSLRSPAIKFQSGGISYSLDHFAPQGELIDIVLMHNAATTNSDIPVTAAVWTPFYFQGHRILDTGDKLLGRAAKGQRKRLNVSFDKVILKSGKSMPISAIALDVDGTLGIEGYQVGDALVQQLGMIVGDAVGEFLSKFGQNVQNTTQDSGYYNSGSNNQYDVSYDVKSALGSAVQKATGSIQKALQSELEDNKPYVLVPAGTRARAVLLTPFDSSVAEYGK